MLGIHLIGAGVGESVVLELPGESPGVIDCYSSTPNAESPEDRLAANPTLRFLVETLQADSLAFLAVTHPHEDHARGVSQLLEHFGNRIGELWMYESWQEITLQNYFGALRKVGIKLPVEKLCSENAGTFYLELLKTRNLAKKLLDRRSSCRIRRFQGFSNLSLCGDKVAVHFLGPSDERAERYKTRLIDNLEDVVGEDLSIRMGNWKPFRVDLNEISSGCAVKYGRTTLILGGDIKSEAWRDIVEERTDIAKNHLAAHFVKAAHHGSATGYTEGLYEIHSTTRRPIAALTPKTTSHLPKPTGVEHIGSFCEGPFATNRVAIGRYSPKLSERAENAWADLLYDHPEWVSVVSPALVEGQNLPRASEVPEQLIELLRRRPSLIPGIREDLRDQAILNQSPLPHTECRLSFYFDDRGNELRNRRFIGSFAGCLS